MVKHTKLLDCTLRDGAYLLDKRFGDDIIKGIIRGLVKAKVDYIEIGFFQDDGFGEGKTVFKDSKDAGRFVPDNKNGCEFTVLADYSRFSVNNLDKCDGSSIDVVRECFFKHERFDALDACRVIKEKGYKLFVQPVDILGYTDLELIEFIRLVNEIEPYCFSIVDTFGSMYQEDLHRVFELINHNLSQSCAIGFHSHNNMQLSSALSQEFIRMTAGKRRVVIDGTINGMGRGAGNTPTELVTQYMVSKWGYSYDIDALLDIIDSYMDNIKSRCSWGYTTSNFIAGCYSAHVNNIAFLLKKNSIRSKDIRYILNRIGASARKRYDYELLGKSYMELLDSDINDENTLEKLKTFIGSRTVLVLAPGYSVNSEIETIKNYITKKKPVVIAVNFIHDSLSLDYIYMSNVKRYQYWKNDTRFSGIKKIFTSNLMSNGDNKDSEIVSFTKLIKCGWEHLDNSTIMLLRLLDILHVQDIGIAGFDGYHYANDGRINYASKALELSSIAVNPAELNTEIESILEDFKATRVHKEGKIEFVTPSRFSACFR